MQMQVVKLKDIKHELELIGIHKARGAMLR